MLLTDIVNSVFYGVYPVSWATIKMFSVYKKGLVSDPNNSRGISIANILPKLYDGILKNRLTSWYQPCTEQAGAQPGQGCTEQLLTLRLYIDIARKQKRTLYVMFIDYVKDYDTSNQNKMLNMLHTQGFGNNFLRALGRNLQDTYNTIGDESFKSTMGVKQGSAISGALFTFYIDYTVKAVRSFGPDDFLQESHILLFMDDTVLLASSRKTMEQKLQLLHNSAKSLNMIFHPTKSQYMVVNSSNTDPFIIENKTVTHTDCKNITWDHRSWEHLQGSM